MESKILRVLLFSCKMISRGRERSVRGVRMGKSGPLERVQLANQVQLRTAQMLEKYIEYLRENLAF